MTTLAVPRTSDPVADVVPSPSIGSVAQTRLAGDAARVLQWLRVLDRDIGAAEVAAALGALGALRTDLRSLRPILDKEWTVSLRAGLDELTETLAAVHRLDGRSRLLVACRAARCAPGRALIDTVAAERSALHASVRAALCPETSAGLAFLASGREPAPLRVDAPVGDPGLPAAVLLPPMLHRRWRKLVRETPVQDLEAMHRRASELLVVIEVGSHCDVRVPGLGPAVEALRVAADAALRVVSANELKERLPTGATRRHLARIVKEGARSTRDVEKTLARVAGLGRLLPVDARGPAKVAAGGVVVRPGATEPEVLVVHRVRHDDWSLPKGSTQPGEAAEQCALREVREETGLRCRLGQELRCVSYRDRNKRAKTVRFWHMTPLGWVGPPAAAEVDGLRWEPLSRAASVLTRARDREVVAAFRREFGATERRSADLAPRITPRSGS